MISSQRWQRLTNVITNFPDIHLAVCPEFNCQVQGISYQQQQTSVQTLLRLSA
jgi:hypothetical protein